jgi:hypothetical protein
MTLVTANNNIIRIFKIYLNEFNLSNISDIEKFYKQITYHDIALSIRLLKDESIHHTIHKQKEMNLKMY